MKQEVIDNQFQVVKGSEELLELRSTFRDVSQKEKVFVTHTHILWKPKKTAPQQIQIKAEMSNI